MSLSFNSKVQIRNVYKQSSWSPLDLIFIKFDFHGANIDWNTKKNKH